MPTFQNRIKKTQPRSVAELLQHNAHPTLTVFTLIAPRVGGSRYFLEEAHVDSVPNADCVHTRVCHLLLVFHKLQNHGSIIRASICQQKNTSREKNITLGVRTCRKVQWLQHVGSPEIRVERVYELSSGLDRLIRVLHRGLTKRHR